MFALLIQIQRDGEWRKITTVKVDHARHDPDGSRARARAFVEAQRQLTGWQNYDGFAGLQLRIAEQTGYDQFTEVRPC